MSNTHTSRWICLLTSLVLVNICIAATFPNPGVLARLKTAVSYDFSSGLIAYWRLEEASGSRTDASGSGNSLAVLATDPGRTTGIVNFGLDLSSSGVNDLLQIADNASISMDGSTMSFQCWVKYNTAPVNNTAVFAKWNGDEEYLLWHTGSRFQVAIRNSGDTANGSVNADTIGAPSSGVWYHVCGGYDGSTVWVQVNGGARDSVSYSSGINDSTVALTVGEFTGLTASIDATIDELALWKNRTLSSDEVIRLYNGGSGRDLLTNP